ncbi:TetR/AcrR family transcriptional regulator [Pseudohaliea rubra]|uniref:Transcriptional regulator, TetR family n=1 Tax=Pseudohaliea rubra DSM 19751 TaxID=1265313 RepID=A0A095XTY5_9GAMM|nr:TetR/AcrR family transcriptional regulator [Pseudohaliea rubra]KGE03096.1 Transcriptional regulator, TetR family [Pseudohaliea rubra DSM 19751]
MNANSKTTSRTRLERREQEILRAATELFASNGFHTTSTRRIAEAAGVSEGTVFHYFGSKHDLMLAILDRFYTERLCRQAETILNEVMGTRERLRALALNHVQQLAADRALMMRLIQVYIGVDLLYVHGDDEAPERDSPIRALNRAYVGYFDRILREGMARGEIRGDVALPPCRDLFFGGLEYGMRTYLYRHRGSADAAIGDYAEELVEPLWRYLQADRVTAGATADTDRESLTRRLEQVTRRLEQLAEG